MKFLMFFFCWLKLLENPIFAESLLKFEDNTQKTQAIQQFISDVEEKLPPVIKEKIRSISPQLKFENFSNPKSDEVRLPLHACFPTRQKQGLTGYTLGSYSPAANVLRLEKRFLWDIENRNDPDRKFPCGHQSMYKLAIATALHELSHAFDLYHEKKGKISADKQFLHLADIKRHGISRRHYAQKESHSPDTYEYEHAEERFAVNMEYFLLDPEYGCRRPSMFTYLRDKLHYDPFPQERICKPHTQTTINSSFEEVDLSPDKIYRVDYVYVTPGGETASGFGHSMLRLVRCAPSMKNPLTGTIIPERSFGAECVADTEHHLYLSYAMNGLQLSMKEMLKAVMSKSHARLFLLKHSDVMMEYTRLDQRNIQIFPLALSEREKEILVYKAIEHLWNFNGIYKLQNANCATYAENLVRSATENPIIQHKKSRRPFAVIKDLYKAGLTPSLRPAEEFESFFAKNLTLFTKKLLPPGKKEPATEFKKYLTQDAKTRLERLTLQPEGTQKVSFLATFLLIEEFVRDGLRHQLDMKLIAKIGELLEITENDKRLKLINKPAGSLISAKSGYGLPVIDGYYQIHRDALCDLQTNYKEAIDKVLAELKDDPLQKEFEETHKNISDVTKKMREHFGNAIKKST